MNELSIEGCTLKVRIEGQDTRPALVLSHMLGTDLTLWDALLPELTKHFRVVRYDTRGHGGSGLGDGSITLDRLGRDVVAILDELGIERAHFCGLSMGGAVGLWLLAHAPARIERAVIAGSAAKLGEPAVWNARVAAALADGMEQAVEPTIERWFSPAFVERAPDPVEAIRALLRGTSAAGYAACCGALRDMDLREAVRGVANPVLVLRGADDPTATATDAGYLVESMANATAAEIDAKHCAVIEDGAAFATAAVKFLTAKTAPGRRPAAKASTRPKPSARRVGSRGVVAARRPVAKTAPVSGKAVAKASATRKTAARAAPPAPSRRRAAAKPTRAAASKTATRKDTEAASSKPGKGQAAGRAKPASGRGTPAAKSAPASARRAAVTMRTAARAKPPITAALKAAKTKAAGAPGRKASIKATTSAQAKTLKPAAAKKTTAKAPAGKTRTATASAKSATAKTSPAKAPPAKSKAAKSEAAKSKAAKTTATKAPAARAARAAKPKAAKPAASRRTAPAAKPRRSPGRGTAGSGRRKL